MSSTSEGHPATRPPGPPPRLGLTVVVCAHTEERWASIAAGLRALADQRPAPAQIVLVIDHNRELQARARADFPGIDVVENRFERGLAGARNTGVACATGDVVAFLDDDAVPRAGWVAAFLDAFADPAVLGTGGLIVPDWVTGRPAWFPDEFLWVVGCSYPGVPTRRAPVRNPIGASMAYRRVVFDQVGGFAVEHSRVGLRPTKNCDETQFSIRLRTALPGAVILQVPEAVVDHEVTPQRTTFAYFVDRCWSEGRSKALLSSEVTASLALETERRYTRVVLPAGVLRGLREAAAGDTGGLARSAAIVVGLAATAIGYLAGRGSWRRPGGSAGQGAGIGLTS